MLRHSQGLIVSPEDLVTTGDVSLPSVEDGPMVIQHYNNLTVQAGHTLTVANRCKGLILVVHNTLTVNGTITMTNRGCVAEGADEVINNLLNSRIEISWPTSPEELDTYLRKHYFSQTDIESELIKAGMWPSISYLNPRHFPQCIIPAVGADGGPSQTTTNPLSVSSGAAGVNRQTGGGGAGGSSYSGVSGAGGAGTSYSGGPGGGGAVQYGVGGDGSPDGGPGGAGAATGGGSANGGAGNPGGAGAKSGYAGSTGTGGLLVIVARIIVINPGGLISSDGADGGLYVNGVGGGGSGAGSINMFWIISYQSNGTVRADGGLGGYGVTAYYGGNGGAGCITIEQMTGDIT
jgi:hypothetical protein